MITISIEVSCSRCGKRTLSENIDVHPRIAIGRTIIPDATRMNRELYVAIDRTISDNRWIIERNGDHFDTYCSQRCAR